MTGPLRNHGDHGGATTVNAVQAPQWHRASDVTGYYNAGIWFCRLCNFSKVYNVIVRSIVAHKRLSEVSPSYSAICSPMLCPYT